ncbi:DUF6207 family protein [Streptomyces humi]
MQEAAEREVQRPVWTDWWATATADRTTRDAGEPGVRLRCHLDLRQPVGSDAPSDEPPQAAEVRQ